MLLSELSKITGINVSTLNNARMKINAGVLKKGKYHLTLIECNKIKKMYMPPEGYVSLTKFFKGGGGTHKQIMLLVNLYKIKPIKIGLERYVLQDDLDKIKRNIGKKVNADSGKKERKEIKIKPCKITRIPIESRELIPLRYAEFAAAVLNGWGDDHSENRNYFVALYRASLEASERGENVSQVSI